MKIYIKIDHEALEFAIDEGRSVLKNLLSGNAVPFRGMTGSTLPRKPGIYAIVDQKTGEFLYAGMTHKGLKDRIWVGHRTVGGGSDLAQVLVKNNIAKTLREGREWMEERCAVLYLTEDELIVDIKIAEHFIISILRPKFNK